MSFEIFAENQTVIKPCEVEQEQAELTKQIQKSSGVDAVEAGWKALTIMLKEARLAWLSSLR